MSKKKKRQKHPLREKLFTVITSFINQTVNSDSKKIRKTVKESSKTMAKVILKHIEAQKKAKSASGSKISKKKKKYIPKV